MFDKYAPYIFSAYGIAAAILGGLVLWSVVRVIQAKKKLDAVERPGEPDTKEGVKP